MGTVCCTNRSTSASRDGTGVKESPGIGPSRDTDSHCMMSKNEHSRVTTASNSKHMYVSNTQQHMREEEEEEEDSAGGENQQRHVQDQQQEQQQPPTTTSSSATCPRDSEEDYNLKDVLPSATDSRHDHPGQPAMEEERNKSPSSPPAAEQLPTFDPLASITAATAFPEAATAEVIQVVCPNHTVTEAATTSTQQHQHQHLHIIHKQESSPLGGSAELSNNIGSESMRSASTGFMRASGSSVAGGGVGGRSSTGDPPLFSHVSNLGAYSTSTYGDSSNGKRTSSFGLAESAIQRHMNAILNPHVSGGSGPSSVAASHGADNKSTAAELQRLVSLEAAVEAERKGSHVSFVEVDDDDDENRQMDADTQK